MNFDWIRSLISFCRTSCKSVLTTSASNLWLNVYLCCSLSSDVAKWVFTWNDLNELHMFPIRSSTILAWQHDSRPCREHTYTRSVTSQKKQQNEITTTVPSQKKVLLRLRFCVCHLSWFCLWCSHALAFSPNLLLSAFICFIQFLWEGHTEHCEWSESWARAKAHYVTLDLISFSIPTTQNNEEKRSEKNWDDDDFSAQNNNRLESFRAVSFFQKCSWVHVQDSELPECPQEFMSKMDNCSGKFPQFFRTMHCTQLWDSLCCCWRSINDFWCLLLFDVASRSSKYVHAWKNTRLN